jgi:hypothetical protein
MAAGLPRVCILIVSAGAAAVAQAPGEILQTSIEQAGASSAEAAKAGLPTLVGLMRAGAYQLLSCGQVNDVSELSLGAPIAGIFLNRATLQAADKNLAVLAQNVDSVLYPVQHAGRPCAAELLLKRGEAWSLTEYRSVDFLHLLGGDAFYLKVMPLDTIWSGHFQNQQVLVHPMPQSPTVHALDFIELGPAIHQLNQELASQSK